MNTHHFISLLDLPPETLIRILQRAIELKRGLKSGDRPDLFRNKTLGMIFEKASTRTRVSFESAMSQGGGHAIFLSAKDTQLVRGEPIEDTAKVIASMVDIICIRTFAHESLETFAANSSVPVINALTDDYHPCQLLADMQTFFELRGPVMGKKVAWVGDGNNMCQSYINAAKQFDFELSIACPEGYTPNPDLVRSASDRVSLTLDAAEAVANAHLVVTDVWASMGQEEASQDRKASFLRYQVTPKLMDKARSDALFMHCLPAHRGEEVSHDMLEDPRSAVWQEAENRLHAQKALLEALLPTQ